MRKNVLYYLEDSARNYPEKIALMDDVIQLSYHQTLLRSQAIGTALCKKILPRQSVGIYMEKNARTLCAFFGCVYAGCAYSFLNPELPPSRLQQIVSVLKPSLIITARELENAARDTFPDSVI